MPESIREAAQGKKILFLFIGESIGMQELILIGVIALLVFGPRKLPQMAKTFGKAMSEFRRASSEFRQTWEREVNLETDIETEKKTSLPEAGVSRNGADSEKVTERKILKEPEIREISSEEFEKLKPVAVPAEEKESEPVAEKGKPTWF